MDQITAICKNCNRNFSFSKKQKDFYEERDFFASPFYCPDCRQKIMDDLLVLPARARFVCCAKCGKETKLPFVPVGDNPPLCRECFEEAKDQGLE